MPKLNWKKILLIVLALAGAGVFLLSAAALAQTSSVPDLGLEPIREELGLPDTDIRLIVARIIRTALGLLGIIAVVLILYGGFVWMTAGGNEENIQKAKKILINAAIGLAIILSAYAIASFVIRALVGATTGGEGGEGGEGGSGGFAKVFYITSMPGNDFGCGARNLHPVIRFNSGKVVDLATVPGNLVIRNKADFSSATGSWAYLVSGGKTVLNAIVFNPEGDCGVPGHNDCLDASTTYQIYFANAANIKTQAPESLGLNCNAGNYKKQCTNNPSVEFTTGAGVDVEAPTITIIEPFENQNFAQGVPITVNMNYTDDFGLQDISLFINDADDPVGLATMSGCKKSGTSTIVWPTGSSPTGTYALHAFATDIAANSGFSTRHVVLFPAHCFDNELNFGETMAGPPACGDGCGKCAGESCTQNSDCASGWCEDGVCVNRMRINKFDPVDGAASSTYVTISGQFFGDDGGHAYFTKQGGGWTEAFVVSCGAGIDNWTQYQLVVKVPADAADGYIKVATAEAPTDGSDDTTRRYTDITDNDGWGYYHAYDVTDVVKPGLCALKPNFGSPYSSTTLIGENFGDTNNSSQDKVMFGSSTAIIKDWASRSVTARVPALGTGPVEVKIYNEGLGSNGVRYDVREALDKDAPVIESINPEIGAKGEYITITGKNFGTNVGKVLFKMDGDGEAKYGSFDFPADCEGSTWSANQIIVKFPEGEAIAINHNYSVQIQRSSDAKIGPIGPNFKLVSGNPAPGICKLDPNSAPIPFNPSSSMKIYGEYYQRGGVSSSAYFWLAAASSTSISGRTQATDTVSLIDTRAELRPPNDTQTGPVVMYRESEGKMGNSLPFTVFDCVQNNSTCYAPGTRCCTSGSDKGQCKLELELCAGETRSTGYMWRFSTGPFPPVPKVLERCNAATDLGQNLPSPSPDIRWTFGGNFDHYNACRTALVNIEFTMKMDQATIDADSIQIFKCISSTVTTTYFNTLTSCQHDGGALLLAGGSYSLNLGSGNEFGDTQYIQLIPSALRWDDNAWYHVVLDKGIKSEPSQYEFNGETQVLPAQDLVANNSCGGNSAYCFVFKTDARQCKLNKVIVTPYTYWTSILEEPIKYRILKDNADDPGSTLYYRGNGLSDQHCIMMDTRNFDWTWSSQRPPYAEIYGMPTGTNGNMTQVSALKNTVAVALFNPDDAVAIRAHAYWDGETAPTPPEEEELTDVLTGIVGWWKFDEGSGTSITDSNENAHDGAVLGTADYVEGKMGTAINLNGSTKVVLSNPMNFPSGSSPRTMCGWGKPVDTTNGWRWLMAYGTGSYNSAMFIGYNGESNSAVGGSYGNDILSPNFWIAGEWKHICLVFDGTNATLYGNGSQLSSMPMAWNLVPNLAYIGAQVHAADPEYWRGAIDDVRVYNRALSAGEIEQIYDFANESGGGGAEEEEGGTPQEATGESPLTIDLSQPKVVDYWPKCLEACTNAEIGAKFNVAMANVNLANAVYLEKCNDENCLSYSDVSPINISLDPADRRYLRISLGLSGSELATDTVYVVALSASGTSQAVQNYQLWSGASAVDEYAKAKPMQQTFIWRFKTKKEKCVLDSVNILPALFQAVYMHDRHPYSAEARSAPDACDPKGQKLDVWTIDWDWTSKDTDVATVREFQTKGRSPLCNSNCTRKGSDVTADAIDYEPLCGNNFREAGEDCDPPAINLVDGVTTTVCTMNCLRPGNNNTSTCGNGIVDTVLGEECDPDDDATKVGCSNKCIHIGSSPATGAEDVTASICGNGKVGTGEECDLGIDANYNYSSSSLNCSSNCLHMGTNLSASWCAANTSTLFSVIDYKAACAKAKSQCGDGITSPAEDPGCDTGPDSPKVNANCSSNCLGNNYLIPECQPTTTVGIVIKRVEGCGDNWQLQGSSLMYTVPSVCGDGIVGTGEEASCESGFAFTHSFVDPWSLATGVGNGDVVVMPGNIRVQTTDIQGEGTSVVNSQTYKKSNTGEFRIVCGMSSDEECESILGAGYGLASNSCCMLRPVLISTYPVKDDINPPYDICPNTYIEAKFNRLIDQATLPGNILIARGTTSTCGAGSMDVTIFVEGDHWEPEEVGYLPWYRRLWHGIVNWFAKIFGTYTSAAPYTINPYNRYCVGDEAGTPMVVADDVMHGAETTSTVMIRLKKALATSTDYVVLFRSGVKDIQGVSVPSTTQWKFITGEEICTLNSVSISPDNYMFNRADSSASFIASSTAANGQQIQSVDGYRWEFAWNPMQNDYITLTNTTDTVNLVTAKNRNGELDLLAASNFTENIYTADSPVLTGKSRITVFICENPWPSSSTVAFPFKDTAYDFSSYYCMDSGSTGVADDLPYVTSTKVWIQETTPFKKRYLFTNSENKDAIGVQVFYNTGHLSVQDWYAAQGFGGNMNSLKIDGYDAISDGNNYYIDALNYQSADDVINIYSNIYQFSINNDATQETKQVFEQMMKNLKFNERLKNDKYCATGYGPFDAVRYDMTCQSDLDCLANMEAFMKAYPTTTIPELSSCLNQKEKLQRNYQRLKDLRGMITDINFGRGAIAVLPMEGASYGKTPDITNNGFEASIITSAGLSFDSGYNGQALKIAGSGKLESSKPIGAVVSGKTFTLSGWIQTTSTNSDTIINIGSYSFGGMTLYFSTDGKLSPGIGSHGIGTFLSVSSDECADPYSVNDGSWHHFAAEFINGSTKEIKLYIDGKLRCSKSGTHTNIQTTAKLSIGSLVPDSANFSGLLDDIRIYGRDLSEDEISALYNNTLPYKGGYPLLKDNTYLPGQALSVWTDAWTQLNTEVGVSLPVDPINKITQSGTCFQKAGEAYLPCYKDADCAAPPQIDHRMSYWTADDRTFDEGVLQNHASTEGSVDYADGKGHGKAFEFTGDSTAKVIAPHKEDYNSDNFTIAAWIYPTKKNTATIMKMGGTDVSGNSTGGFALEYSGFWTDGVLTRFNNGTIRFAFFPTSTSEVKYYSLDSNGTPLTLNTWHYVVIVFQKTKKLKMFIDNVEQSTVIRLYNGSELDTASIESFPIEDSTANIEIGQNFNGKIDNVAFYDTNLVYQSASEDDNEVKNLYKGLCVLHDPATGWSAEDRRFSFACNKTSYAYRYIGSSASNSFLLRANMEKYDTSPAYNESAFYADFVGDYVDFSTGVCQNANEISSPYNIICGDGILGGEEDCDPPGKTKITSSACPGGSAQKQTCLSSCNWGPASSVSCYSVTGGNCGDGKVQSLAGETCDDGALNGQSGRCKAPDLSALPPEPGCNGIAQTCGNGTLDFGEFCDTVTASGQCEFRGGAEEIRDPKGEPIFYFLVDLTGTMNSGFTGAPPPGNRVAMVKYSLPLIAERFSDPDSKAKIGVGSYNCPVNSFHNKDWLPGTKGYFTSSQVETAISSMTHQTGQNTDSVFDWFRNNIFPILNSGADEGKPINLVYITDGGMSGSCTPAGASCPTNKIAALYNDAAMFNNQGYGVVTHIIGVGSMAECDRAAMAAAGHGQYLQITAGADALADAMTEIYKQPCETYSHYSGYSCRWDCKGFGDFCGDGIIQNAEDEECEEDVYCALAGGEQGKRKCEDCKLGECEAIVTEEVSGACGNGVVEEDEACDRGDKNGISCTAVYPQKYCTYCTSDCKNIITVDNLCGNGSIDTSLGEVCDPEAFISGNIRFFRPSYSNEDRCLPCKNDCSEWDTGASSPNDSTTDCAAYWGYCGDGIKQILLDIDFQATSFEECDGTDGISDCATDSCPDDKPYAKCNTDCTCGCSATQQAFSAL